MRHVHDVLYDDHAIVTWSDSADVALARMGRLGRDELAVVDGSDVIGLCHRDVLLAHQARGSWLGSIAVVDVMRRGPFWCHEEDGHDHVRAVMDRLRTNTLAVLDKDGQVIGTIHRSQLDGESRAARTRRLEGAMS